jgi:hypothetical protein
MGISNKIVASTFTCLLFSGILTSNVAQAVDDCARGYYPSSNTGTCTKTSWVGGTYLSDDDEGFDVHAVLVHADASIRVTSSTSSQKPIRIMLQIDCPTGTDALSNYFVNRYKVSFRQSPEVVDFGHSGFVEIKIDNQPWSKSVRIAYNVQYHDPQALVLQPKSTGRVATLLKNAKKSIAVRLVTSSLKPKPSGWSSPSLNGVKDLGTFTKTNFSKEWQKLLNKSSCKFGS